MHLLGFALGIFLRDLLAGKDCSIQSISLGGFHLDNPSDVILLEREIKAAEQFYLSDAPEKEKENRKTLSKSQEYVIRYLSEHGASPLPAIMAAADVCSLEAARKAVYNLASLKMINRTNPEETGQGVEAIYDLVKSEVE
jgi:hypothetical protein